MAWTIGDAPNGGHRESDRRPADRVGSLERQAVADLDRNVGVDKHLTALRADDFADHQPTVVRLGASYIRTSLAPAVHAAGESATVDLNERLDLGVGRRRGVAPAQPIEKRAIRVSDGRYVFRALLSTFDLEADDAEISDCR